MKMKKGLLTGVLTTLMCGAVCFPVEVPEAVANQGASCTKRNTLSRRVDFADLHRAALVATHSYGRGGQSPLMPPQSHAFGKSFEE
jgi:hypothetical protein